MALRPGVKVVGFIMDDEQCEWILQELHRKYSFDEVMKRVSSSKRSCAEEK